MDIIFEYLEEPKLQFGQYFEHEDVKTGLKEFGPFGKNVTGLHPSEIKLGFIGTRETISHAKEWIEECSFYIESKNFKKIGNKTKSLDNQSGNIFGEEINQELEKSQLEKRLNPDFIGFNRHSKFQCCFQMNERWEMSIRPQELKAVLDLENPKERIIKLVDLFEANIESLASTAPSPDIILLALTPEIIEQAHSIRISGNFYLNFRRAIKARAMKYDIPTQILQPKTVLGKGKNLQDKATRAWNFCTAQYYKAEGIPWQPLMPESDVCFIGISFYVAQDIEERLTMRSSVAQAFDYMGQSIVLRGKPFQWNQNKQGKSPHLTQKAACQLIQDTLNEYKKVMRRSPRRIVIHKSSEFWGSEHGEYNEVDGFFEGIENVFTGCESDLVALRQTGVHLFREGRYPPLRGTYFHLEDTHHFLYTMGFIPYLETYPGSYVPELWQITDHYGGSAPKDLFRELLVLTKMNMNNCDFADGTPITLSFSKMIGEIMKHIPENGKVHPKYKFYM